MATMAGEPVFLDTNVLVYASRPSSGGHRAAQAALKQLAADASRLWISRQVLREYLSVVTRPQATAPALPMAAALADIRRFQVSFGVAEDGSAVLERLLHLLATYPGAGKQVHDTNLVANMLECGIHRLLTFNSADFRRFAGVIDLVPLPAP